jgi:hypothetical protein
MALLLSAIVGKPVTPAQLDGTEAAEKSARAQATTRKLKKLGNKRLDEGVVYEEKPFMGV